MADYVSRIGDSAGKISQLFTGSPMNGADLVRANPQKGATLKRRTPRFRFTLAWRAPHVCPTRGCAAPAWRRCSPSRVPCRPACRVPRRLRSALWRFGRRVAVDLGQPGSFALPRDRRREHVRPVLRDLGGATDAWRAHRDGAPGPGDPAGLRECSATERQPALAGRRSERVPPGRHARERPRAMGDLVETSGVFCGEQHGRRTAPSTNGAAAAPDTVALTVGRPGARRRSSAPTAPSRLVAIRSGARRSPPRCPTHT